MKQKDLDPLRKLRTQLGDFIRANYSTVEEFCWANDLNKATVSNFLRDAKDFRVSTLEQIARAMGKTLYINAR